MLASLRECAALPDAPFVEVAAVAFNVEFAGSFVDLPTLVFVVRTRQNCAEMRCLFERE